MGKVKTRSIYSNLKNPEILRHKFNKLCESLCIES